MVLRQRLILLQQILGVVKRLLLTLDESETAQCLTTCWAFSLIKLQKAWLISTKLKDLTEESADQLSGPKFPMFISFRILGFESKSAYLAIGGLLCTLITGLYWRTGGRSGFYVLGCTAFDFTFDVHWVGRTKKVVQSNKSLSLRNVASWPVQRLTCRCLLMTRCI